MLLKAKILILFSLKTKTDLSGSEYAILQYMNCTRPLDDDDEVLDCVFFK